MGNIEFSRLTKRFDDVTAVDGIDLSVNDGEFLVLVGPSGCGKSTTLRMIAGLEEITDGELFINDERMNEVAPKDRHIAMVFQDYALYPHMTARENMRFGMGSASDYSDEEIASRVDHAAGILDIEELLERQPGALSGGERQRVAIGRALVREPEVFLLDEPLANLDAKLRVQMRTELGQLHQELQTTTVYVTHDQVEAMTLGTRVAVMNDGRIQQVDEPQYLYDYPANRFVAEFIGSPAMNLVPVEVRRRDEEYLAVHDAFEIALPRQDALGELAGGPALLGIRPEDISLAENVGGNSMRFELPVSVTEPLGDSLLIHGHVGDTEIEMHAEARSPIRPGDEVTVTFDDERLHLFDATTGDARYHSDGAHTQAPAPETQD